MTFLNILISHSGVGVKTALGSQRLPAGCFFPSKHIKALFSPHTTKCQGLSHLFFWALNHSRHRNPALEQPLPTTTGGSSGCQSARIHSLVLSFSLELPWSCTGQGEQPHSILSPVLCPWGSCSSAPEFWRDREILRGLKLTGHTADKPRGLKGHAAGQELAVAQMVQQIRAKICVCSHPEWRKAPAVPEPAGMLLEPPVLPGRKGMILCLGSFWPPSMGNLSSICI